MSSYLDTLLKRRSIYGISAESPLPNDELVSMLRKMIVALPSAYNMQSQRLVMLLGGAHKKLWEIVLDELRGRTSAERFPKTQQKIGTFAAGHGSLLFFDDTAVTDRLKEENAAYAKSFDRWVLEQNGMVQISSWCLLAEQGLGASLQHYNPIIDDKVKAEWNLPPEWRLLAQMPFGAPTALAGPKDKLDADQRTRFFK